MFIDSCATVVDDRLVTVSKSNDIEVRLVSTGQMVIRIGDLYDKMECITSVPDHSELLLTGHHNGAVHLWDIEKGKLACECMNVNTGVHVRDIVRLKKVHVIDASSTRLVVLNNNLHGYNNYKTMDVVVHFDDEK
jgi:WD40 repeat protein